MYRLVKLLPCSARKLVLLMEWAAGGSPGTVNVYVPVPKPPPNRGPTATKEYVYAILRNRTLIPLAAHSDSKMPDIKINAECITKRKLFLALLSRRPSATNRGLSSRRMYWMNADDKSHDFVL